MAEAVISWAEDGGALEWVNALLANAGDEWDRDEDIWTIALAYVRHLEASAAIYDPRGE